MFLLTGAHSLFYKDISSQCDFILLKQVLFFFSYLQVADFMKFVKGIYSALPSHLPRIFEPRSQKKVKDLSDINVEVWLQDIFTVTTVLTDKKNAENQSVQVGFLITAVSQDLKSRERLWYFTKYSYTLLK